MKRALLGLVIALAARGQERPWTELYLEEATAVNKTCAAKEFVDCRNHLLRLKDLADGRADVIYRLARVEASLGNRAAALEYLSIYSRSGMHLGDPETEPAFSAWKDSPEFQAILARLRTVSEPVTGSKLFATLPENDFLPEDLAYDSVTRRFFVSSVRHHWIAALDKDGKFSNFVPAGPDPMMALVADSRRRWLWATTVNEGKSALWKFSLDSGKLLKHYDPPGAGKHELGDMTSNAAGDIFVSDGAGAVYEVEHERDRLELLIGPGVFRSPQTPAATPDGRRLFVPDYSRGISIVDLATKKWKLLEHPPELSLGGIDGLYLSGQSMVAIQNGVVPERLIRMHLDPGLTKVLSWETIEANWPGLGDPTHGVLAGDRFYFIANSGWEVQQGGAYTPATIRQMPWK